MTAIELIIEEHEQREHRRRMVWAGLPQEQKEYLLDRAGGKDEQPTTEWWRLPVSVRNGIQDIAWGYGSLARSLGGLL